MNSLIKHLTVVLWAQVALTFASGQNLVHNPSFEQANPAGGARYFGLFFPSPPVGDTSGLVQGDATMISRVSDITHNGEFAMCIRSDETVRCAFDQSKFPLVPGQKLRLSGWMRGENLKPQGSMPGGVVRLGFSNSQNAAASQKAQRSSGYLKAPSTDFDWTYLSATVTVPVEADQMVLNGFLWESSGAVWFDDLSVEVIEGPRNTLAGRYDPNGFLRYQEANSVLEAKKPGVSRVIFLGDSITDGWNLERDFPGEGFINRGIGGQDTGQILARLEQDVISNQPDVVWFLGGTNDIAAGFSSRAIMDNIRVLAQKCSESGIRLIICSVLPISDYHKNREARLERSKLRPPERIVSLNEGLRSIAAEEGATYLDLHSRLVDASGQMPSDLSGDGLHPNRDGYRWMAPVVLGSIESEIAKQ